MQNPENAEFDAIFGAANPLSADGGDETNLESGKAIMMVSDPIAKIDEAAAALVEAAMIEGYLWGYVDLKQNRVVTFYTDPNPDTVLTARGMKRVIFVKPPVPQVD
jgi:hypothetical protein